MTYLSIISAAPALQKLVGQELPLPTSYKLFKLIKHINSEIEFFQTKDEELRLKHGDVNSPSYIEDINALLGFQTDWDEEPVEIKIAPSISLSLSDINALEPFVMFVE